MDLPKYEKSPHMRRNMNIMDTVSGRSCKYTRMELESTGDAYIEIPSLRRTDSSTNHMGNHERAGSNKVPSIVTCSAMDSFENKNDPPASIEYGETYNSESARSNRSVSGSIIQRRRKCRFIKKSGHCNVSHANVSDKPQRFMADIFTTCVDLRWRWNLLLFTTAFIISWLVFGVVYWIISFAHGDFADNPEGFTMCVNNLDPNSSFTSAFLFSLETQTTIGYGFRVVTEECPMAILMVVIQSVFGCIIDAFMIGLIMAKISRPKKRAETLLFSKKAVINVRDGQMCFMVRVGNLRKSHLVEATIRMQYLYSRETLEGEFIPLEQVDLHLDLKNDSDRLFLVTPQTICHPIDEKSPLFNISKESMSNSDFEIIVILEGMVEATGMTTQARASYLPGEILWGHRFENVISFSHTNGYNVDFRKFDLTYPTPDIPTCSPADLQQSELISNSSSVRKSRPNVNSASRRRRQECNGSEGRDSGITAVEDDQPSDSTKTLDSTSSSGSGRSSKDLESKRRSWKRRKQENRMSRHSQENCVILAMGEDEQAGTNRGKTNRFQPPLYTTQARNEKNAALNQFSARSSNKVDAMPVAGVAQTGQRCQNKDQIALDMDDIEDSKIGAKQAPILTAQSHNHRALNGGVVQSPHVPDMKGIPVAPIVKEEPDENASLLDNKSPEKTIPDVVTMQNQVDRESEVSDKEL